MKGRAGWNPIGGEHVIEENGGSKIFFETVWP
jgi:hypothetical protein